MKYPNGEKNNGNHSENCQPSEQLSFELRNGKESPLILPRSEETGSPSIFENQLQREWLSAQEAAKFLSVSVGALRNMVYRGQIRVHKIGKRAIFRVEDCRRFFERKGA